MYPHPTHPTKKCSLRYLAKKYLKKTIQNKEKTGHDSAEDAITTLELAQLKIEKGTLFGVGHDQTGSIEHDQTCSLLQILEKCEKKNAHDGQTGSSKQVFCGCTPLTALFQRYSENC